MSLLIKSFEIVVRCRVSHFTESNLVVPNQQCFRNGRGGLRLLLYPFQDILKAVGDRSNAGIKYLDFNKPFKKVNYILFKKFSNCGMQRKLLKWIKSRLVNGTQHVIINGIQSSTADVIIGVPHGTALGLRLFLISIKGHHQGH